MSKNISNKKVTNRKFHFYKRHVYAVTYLIGLGMSFLFVPFFAFAATTYSQDLFGLFQYLKDIINDIVLWLFTTGAVLIFLGFLSYRLFQLSQGDKDIAKTNKYILYGLIALTLMFTFYAVAALIAVTFGIRIGIPQFFGGQTLLTPGTGNVLRSYSVIGR